MNYNYIPKQPIVQAFQLTKERWEDRKDWPWWLTEEVARGWTRRLSTGVQIRREFLPWGHWIVRFATGRWETWSPKGFAEFYSPYLGQRGSFGAREDKG